MEHIAEPYGIYYTRLVVKDRDLDLCVRWVVLWVERTLR